MASRELHIGFDEYSNLKCSICSKRNKVANANYYCYDCQKHLCTHCLAYHDDFDKNHNVVQLPGDDNDVKCGENAGELITLCQEKSFRSLIEKGITTEQNMSSLSAVVGAEDRSVQAPVWQQGSSRVGGLVEKPSGLKAQNRSRQVGTVSIQPPGEYSCSISGACHLVNGSLVIADSSNRRLMLVDPTSGKITNCCLTDEEPTNICCTGPQNIAVVFGFTNARGYCTACLSRTQTIVLEHETNRIACHGRLLYCANNVWGKITMYVYDVNDGSKLQEIYLKDYYIPTFSDFTVNASGDRLYVTDSSFGLLCVNVYGQQIFHFSLADLGVSDAQGVATDNRGHVFVCGYESNNVVKVTEDGHVVREILSGRDGVECPRCLSYDVSRSQLCVGGEGDQILIVEWK